MQLDFAASALLGGVDDAGVKGTRIYVHAHGALIELTRIKDPMDGFERVDGAGVRRIHLDGLSGFDGGFTQSDVLMHDVKILDEQPADGNGHPAVLVAVIVHGTGLSDFPADGD